MNTVSIHSVEMDELLCTNVRKWDGEVWLYSNKDFTCHSTNTYTVVAFGES